MVAAQARQTEEPGRDHHPHPFEANRPRIEAERVQTLSGALESLLHAVNASLRGVRIVDEFEAGFGWQPDEPEFMQRTSHAVASGGKVWLFDALDVEGLDDRVRELGEPAGVVQLLDRHGRDCAVVAERLGVPHSAAGSAFSTIRVVRFPRWRESAAFFPQERVLVVADAVGTARYFRTQGERIAVHPLLRLVPPRKLSGLAPEHVLCGHGKGVHGPDAAEALEEALRTSRRRIPRWLAASVKAWRKR